MGEVGLLCAGEVLELALSHGNGSQCDNDGDFGDGHLNGERAQCGAYGDDVE